jgi:hypothetical protein
MAEIDFDSGSGYPFVTAVIFPFKTFRALSFIKILLVRVCLVDLERCCLSAFIRRQIEDHPLVRVETFQMAG